MLKEPTDKNREIVKEIGENNLLWKVIMKITDNGKTAKDPGSLMDLHQDLILSLLLDDKLATVYDEGHLNYYLTRCVMNNIISSSSRYYRTYIMSGVRDVSLNEAITRDEGTD